jgi:hypothetical protein
LSAAPDNLMGRRAVAFWQQCEQFILFVLVFSLPMQVLALIPGTTLTVTKVGGAMLIAAVFLRRLMTKQWPFVRTGLGDAIVLFGLACATSSCFAANRLASFRATLTLLEYAFLFYATAAVASDDFVQERIPALLGGACFVAGVGAVLAWSGRLLPPTVDRFVVGSSIRRVCFGLPDANEQAMFFVFALALLLFNSDYWRNWQLRAFSGATVAGMGAGLLLTMSRTAWLCAGLLVLARVLTVRRRLLYLGGLALLLTFFGIGATIFRPQLVESVRRRASEATAMGDTSLASRIMQYTAAVGTAWRGGAFGHGLGSAPELSRQFQTPLGDTTGSTVHNVPLIFWLELGWFGLLCYGWLWSAIAAALILGFRRVPRGVSRERILAYGMLIVSFAVTSLAMPFVYRSAFPILLGCAVGAVRMGLSAPISDMNPRA